MLRTQGELERRGWVVARRARLCPGPGPAATAGHAVVAALHWPTAGRERSGLASDIFEDLCSFISNCVHH
jgi:hypothetical protein